jgi:cell division protein FtsZ
MFLPGPQAANGLPRIKIVGIGGAGIHIVSALSMLSLPIELIAMDSSSATLESVANLQRVRLGPKTSRGMGCGSSIDAGAQTAHASRSEIASVLEGAELLLLVAGLGGGVGSGGIRVVAEIAMQMNIPTICFVTKPFRFEGLKRATIANTVQSALERETHGVLSIEHDKLQTHFPKNITLVDAMNVGSQYLQKVIEQLLHVVQVNALINVDFADILSLFRTHGQFALGVVDSSIGADINSLIRDAIHHPLTCIAPNYKATGILVFAEAGEDFDLGNLTMATEFVDEISSDDTQVIFGVNSVEGDYPLRITVLATGIRAPEKVPASNSFLGTKGR